MEQEFNSNYLPSEQEHGSNDTIVSCIMRFAISDTSLKEAEISRIGGVGMNNWKLYDTQFYFQYFIFKILKL